MKAQILADFIIECTWVTEEKKQKLADEEVNQEMANEEYQELCGYSMWMELLIPSIVGQV